MDTLLTSNYNDYYEKMRFQLTLRISIVLAIFLAVLGIAFYFFNPPIVNFTIAGVFICGSSIALLILTRRYKISAGILTVTGTVLSIMTLLTVQEAYHFVDPLWMLIVSLFTYFTLGKKIGNITLLIQFISISYYGIFNLRENLEKTPELTNGQVYSLAINCFICGLIITYLIHQFLNRNEFAAEQYRKLTEELQQKNDLVEEQNREKTAMLKEIHHRVKNNLQVITSLLRLQSRDIENDASVHHFKEAIDRIGAMALIHNQMYQSKDLNRIELEPYLRSLSKNILDSYLLNIPVKIDFHISLTHTPSNMIVPIALLFNELISNTLKHAFNEQTSGKIEVKVIGNIHEDIFFTYRDNGVWKKPVKEDSFGLELIDTLAQQLNGNVSRNTENGTQYDFILRSDR